LPPLNQNFYTVCLFPLTLFLFLFLKSKICQSQLLKNYENESSSSIIRLVRLTPDKQTKIKGVKIYPFVRLCHMTCIFLFVNFLLQLDLLVDQIRLFINFINWSFYLSQFRFRIEVLIFRIIFLCSGFLLEVLLKRRFCTLHWLVAWYFIFSSFSWFFSVFAG
jgi:hypothetical protein